MTTGDRIKKARLAAGLTQSQLAEKIGVKFSAIHKYETGMVKNLKRETIAALAEALDVKPSWFGYLISVKAQAPFTKQQLVEYLEAHGVGTRQLFAGNLLRQPMMVDNDIPLRIGSSPVLKSCDLTEKEYALLPQTDFIMNHTFWVGTFPALGEAEMEKIAQTIRHLVHENQR